MLNRKIIYSLAIACILLFQGINTKALVESCYLKIEINEVKENEQIKFSLDSLENIYGNYKNLVDVYSKNNIKDYILVAYNSRNTAIASYSLSSARFMYFDTFVEESPGGIVESNEGIITSIIPYNSNIKSLKVDNKGAITDLKINSTLIKCQRSCLIANETGVYGEKSCCLGYNSFTTTENNFICQKCGDSICSPYETYYSCKQDCTNPDISNADWQIGKINLEQLMRQIKSYYKI